METRRSDPASAAARVGAGGRPSRTTFGLLLAAVALSIGPTSSTAQLGPRIGELGVLDRPEAQVLGRVADVVVDDAGTVFVVDELAHRISVFDRDLRWVMNLGREGAGPGEFGTLPAAAMDGQGRLVVADSRNGRLARYEGSDGGLELEGHTRVERPLVDVCFVGSRAFFHVATPRTEPFGELEESGRVRRTFGGRERPTGELAEQMGDSDHFLNQVHMECDSTAGRVVAAHRFHNLVRALTPEGREAWRTELPDYHQQRFRRADGHGCCAYLIPNAESGTYHVTQGLVVAGGEVLVTLGEWGPPIETRYEVRRLDAATGRHIGRFAAPGRLLAVGAGRAFFASDDPYPRVLVHEFGR